MHALKFAAMSPDVVLAPHQQRALQKLDQSGALLAYHQLGSGKTLLSVAGTEGEPTDVVVPAALRGNYAKEVEAFTDRESPREIRSYEAFQRHGPTPGARALVVDEAHRIGTAGSARSQAIQKAAPGYAKRLLLTGTPIRNEPAELAPLLRTLNPESRIPESPTSFNQMFLAHVPTPVGFLDRLRGIKPGVETRPKNLDVLRGEVRGKVDFHATDRSEFPDVEEHVHRLQMPRGQHQVYSAILKANPDLDVKVRRNLPLSKQELKSLNAFSTAARMASNDPTVYGGPDESPKYDAILDRVRGGGKHLVYSNYLEGGVGGLSRRMGDIPHGVFSGALNDAERKQLVADYNAGRIQALLTGPAGTEGLDLKGTSDVHVLEPHWNEPRVDQAIGRAVRFRSHADLPPEQRKVQVHRYLAEPPPPGFVGRLFGRKPDTGIDEYLTTLGKRKAELNDQFLQVLREEGSRST